jgi:hypothetical protein
MKALFEPYNLLRVAAVGALIALVLMVAGLLLPAPVPLILFMSAGQGLGTLSLALYVVVVIIDLRRAGVLQPPERARAEPVDSDPEERDEA